MGWPKEGSAFPRSQTEASRDTNPWQTLVSQGSPGSSDFILSGFCPLGGGALQTGGHQLMATTPPELKDRVSLPQY